MPNKDIKFGYRLKLLRKSRGLIQTKVANSIKISYSAVQDHEGGKWPNKNNQNKYIDFYRCDRDWFLTGLGEPFPKKDDGAEPVPDNKIDPASLIGEPKVGYMSEGLGDFKFSEAIAMAARVLESGTSYATALFLNIQHFDMALKSEARISQLEHNQSNLKTEINLLKKHIDDLRKRSVRKRPDGIRKMEPKKTSAGKR